MTEWGQYPIEREIETLKEDEEKQSEREREGGEASGLPGGSLNGAIGLWELWYIP